MNMTEVLNRPIPEIGPELAEKLSVNCGAISKNKITNALGTKSPLRF